MRCTEHVHPIADATSAIVRSDSQYANSFDVIFNPGQLAILRSTIKRPAA